MYPFYGCSSHSMLGRRNTRGSMLEVAPSRSPSSSNLLGCLILVMFCKVFPHPTIPVWLCGKPTNHNPQRVRNVVGGFAVSHIEFPTPTCADPQLTLTALTSLGWVAQPPTRLGSQAAGTPKRRGFLVPRPCWQLRWGAPQF